MMFRFFVGACVIYLGTLGFSVNSQAGVVTISNSTLIKIPGFVPGATSGIGEPFPSIINVTGIANVVDVDVILNGLTHTRSADLDIAILGPTGKSVVLMDEVGAGGTVGTAWSSNTATFSDGGTALGIGTIGTDGTFAPSGRVNCALVPSCVSGGVPAGSQLSVFAGLDPTGDWKLYVNDDFTQDAGNIADGWTLRFTTQMTPVPLPAAFPLLASGLGLLGLASWKRRKTTAFR